MMAISKIQFILGGAFIMFAVTPIVSSFKLTKSNENNPATPHCVTTYHLVVLSNINTYSLMNLSIGKALERCVNCLQDTLLESTIGMKIIVSWIILWIMRCMHGGGLQVMKYLITYYKLLTKSYWQNSSNKVVITKSF